MTSDKRVVIAGGGRVGFRVAELLGEYGHTPVVIERDEERCRHLVDEHVSMVLQGDATDPGLLEEAAVGRCDVLAALTGDGDTNLAVCAEARELAEGVRTIARADSAAAAEEESDAAFVDAVVYPEHAGARATLTHVLGDGFEQFAAMPEGFELLVVRAGEAAPATGRRVKQLRLPVGSRLIGDVTRSVIVTADTTVESGNQYMLALDRDVADEARRLFEG